MWIWWYQVLDDKVLEGKRVLAEKAAPWGLLKNSEITDCFSTKWGHRHLWRAKAWEISNWKTWVKLGLYQKIQYSNLNLKIAWHWLRESMMETLSRQWDCFYIIDSEPCLCLGDPLPGFLVVFNKLNTILWGKACVLAIYALAEPSPFKGPNGFRYNEWELTSTRWVL